MQFLLEKLKKTTANNKIFLLTFIISLTAFSLWFIAFYPGIMSPDSQDQWSQAYNFRFSNHHPYFHTLIIAILQRIWYNPAFIVLIQVVLAAFLGSYFISYLVKKGLNRYIAATILLLYLASPSIAYYNITLWKDVPFSLLIFAFTILLTVHYLDRSLAKSRLHMVLFALLITLTAILRHNGIFLIGLIPLVYYFTNILNWRQSLKLFIACLLGYLIITIPLANLLKVFKPNFMNVAIELHLVGAAISSGGYTPTLEEEEAINSLIPLTSLLERYDCRTSNPIVFNNPAFKIENINTPTVKEELDKATISIVRNNIPAVFGNRVCAFLHLVGLEPRGYLYSEQSDTDPQFVNQYNLPSFHSSNLSNLLFRYVQYTAKMPILNLVFWNTIPYIFIIITTTLVKRSKMMYGFMTISLFNLVPLFLGGVGGDYRFVYSIHIIGLFAIALFFTPRVHTNKIEHLTK